MGHTYSLTLLQTPVSPFRLLSVSQIPSQIPSQASLTTTYLHNVHLTDAPSIKREQSLNETESLVVPSKIDLSFSNHFPHSSLVQHRDEIQQLNKGIAWLCEIIIINTK